MNKLERADWQEHFQRVAQKIQVLASRLNEKSEFNEFVDEMETHIRELETVLSLFKDAVDREN
jgi:exonuclease VII small subunit